MDKPIYSETPNVRLVDLLASPIGVSTPQIEERAGDTTASTPTMDFQSPAPSNIRRLPDISLTNQFFKIHFGDIRKTHALLVDIDADRIYLDGIRIITTQTEKKYHPKFMKNENKGTFQKRRIKTISGLNYVFIIELGWDGRIFFLFFYESDYDKYRGKPAWTASYWHDRAEKTKKVYINNLKFPWYCKEVQVK